MDKPLTAKAAEKTVINRRDIEPLQVKASEVMECYERAVGCRITVLDSFGRYVNTADKKKKNTLCELCRAWHPDSSKQREKDEYPCTAMHLEALSKARNGNSYIYTCEAGLSYWASPLYAGGRHAGSLSAGQVLAISRKEAAEQFSRRYGVPRDKALKGLSTIQEKSHEEIVAMARMLLVCAEKLSSSPGNTNQIKGKTSPMVTTLSMGSTDKSPAMEKFRKKNQAVEWVYPLDKERALLAALRRGDKCMAAKILDELFTLIQKNEYGNFDCIRFFAIELAVILSRAAGGILNLENSYYRCFARLQEARTVEDLSKSLLHLVDHIGPRLFSFLGIRHASALRKAERFIWENYDRKVGLKEIAAASGLSAPYFSTIFKKEMGKNLSTYINQLRIDKAAVYLKETNLPLNEIAKACGFEDQSWFSKIFKAHTGQSPGKYREQGNKKTEGF